jgi:hypothetical protein
MAVKTCPVTTTPLLITCESYSVYQGACVGTHFTVGQERWEKAINH